MDIRVAFHGRKAGAIGITSFQVVDMKVSAIADVLPKLYESFEHITNAAVSRIDGERAHIKLQG